MRAAIYIRVSTTLQAEKGYSVEEQRDILTSYCKIRHWEIFNAYVDSAHSGRHITRPALTKLIADAKKRLFDTVVVYDLKRLSRSQKDTIYLIEDIFERHNISFVSFTESFDTNTPFGKAIAGILSVFAQLECDQIKERMQLGKIGRAKTGKPMTWSAPFCPFGYDYVDGQYKTNEYSHWVNYIFDKFLAGNTISAIANDMTDKKILNKKWYHATVKWILENPVYTGKIRWRGKLYQGKHKAIIDQSTYDLAQKKIPATKKKPKHT
ncbi:recombinase family protein [Streptococcus equi]|uniref:recombinase family protein n=1 Tax=Streptococcus equi TaxID=1336 RepID=UPI000658B51B|nr:recombinase family protein [Streptococcus equi]MCD3372297.1 recombinase family protein [Streptococcus equi subsp. zooepidemicus]MCD3383587.1 recombinase family protein [Streptococcus equi subsp. zooepidemicus]CRV18850.1 site-specific recombinase/resolvase [Streptococcus equi subsp. equi]CRV22320.1 site-specific recombinase/resolvase [Streptococcus equi subsp. equi]HEL0795906.1 recombinase family protein [Streptococcus equi subsp. zooepidemicus]